MRGMTKLRGPGTVRELGRSLALLGLAGSSIVCVVVMVLLAAQMLGR